MAHLRVLWETSIIDIGTVQSRALSGGTGPSISQSPQRYDDECNDNMKAEALKSMEAHLKCKGGQDKV